MSITSHDPDQKTFNFSSHALSPDEKSLLSKGLIFSIPPKRLYCADHMLRFDMFFRDIIKVYFLLMTKTSLKVDQKTA